MELQTETVIDVHHWSDSLFSIRSTRDRGLRFRNGEFAMMGIEIEGRPVLTVDDDRFMLCGSPAMLKSLTAMLDDMGFAETRRDAQHEYVIERAFVEN